MTYTEMETRVKLLEGILTKALREPGYGWMALAEEALKPPKVPDPDGRCVCGCESRVHASGTGLGGL